jgi:hypothetical protein
MYHDWSMYSRVYLTQHHPGASKGHSSQHLHSLAVCTGVVQMTHLWLFPVKKNRERDYLYINCHGGQGIGCLPLAAEVRCN